jgi:hypothetical protein
VLDDDFGGFADDGDYNGNQTEGEQALTKSAVSGSFKMQNPPASLELQSD